MTRPWLVSVTTAPWVRWDVSAKVPPWAGPLEALREGRVHPGLPRRPDPDLAEQGRRLASEREDLIAQGIDPADLHVPLHPDDGGVRT